MAEDRQSEWYPSLRGKVDPELERAVRLILDQVYAAGRFIRDIAATRPTREEVTKQLLSPAKIQTLLQAPGAAPLNINNLPGVLAQPQKTFIPLVTSLPIFADPLSQDGTLIRYSGIVWYFDGTVEPGTWRPLGVLGVVLQDTYANLQDGVTWPASFYPLGTEFWVTDRKQLYLNESVGGVNTWVLILMLPMSDVHTGRYATGTVNATNVANSVVTWVSGSTFNSNWVGRHIIVNGVRCNVKIYTSTTSITVDVNLGVLAGATYYAGYFSVDLTAGVQFFETDRQFLYQAANSTGTVTPNGTTIDWTSGDLFDQTWVGATITINGVDYTVATFVSPVRITVTLTAGTPGAVAFSVKSGKWLLVSTHILGDVHSGRYAVGTVNTTGTAVAWVSGATFNTNWAGRPIIINNVRYTVSSVTSTTALVLTSTAGVQAGVTYYGGYFSVDLIPGVQFFETDRQFSYQTASVSGTVTPNGTTIDWTSGDIFSPTWVGSKITINAVEYVVATVVSAIQLTVTLTAGTPGAVAYSVVSGKWLWVSGQGASTQATLPTDLLTTDAGALWAVTDYMHLLQWSGSAWTFSESDAGSAYIVMGTSAGAPTNGLWGACDGTTYAVLNGNGTTSNIATPNLTGEVFIKGAAAFAAQQAAVRATWEATAKTDNESAHTHAVGTISAAGATTGISVDAHTTAADTAVTGAGTRVTTATHTVNDSGHTHTGTGTSAAGSAHQHVLSDATAQLKVPSEANGGLPLRISTVWFLRR